MRALSSKIAWLGALAALAMLAAPAQAQTTYTWYNGSTTMFNGTWDTTTANWNAGGGQVTWPNNTSPGDRAFFSSNGSTTYNTTVSGTINVDTITINNTAGGTADTWLFNGGTLNLVGAATFDMLGQRNRRVNSVITGSSGLTLLTSSGSRANYWELRLAGNNTYTGVTTVRNSTLAPYHDNALGATGSGNDTEIRNGGRVAISGLNGSSTPLTINEDFRIITQDNAAADPHAIRNQNAVNILNGTVTLVTGTNPSPTYNDRGISTNYNGTFIVNGNITAVMGTGANATNPRLYLGVGSGSLSKIVINGAISQGTGLTLRLLIDGSSNGTNTGTVELAGNNTFSDLVVIRRGTLLLSNANALGNNTSGAQIYFGDGGLGDSTNTLRLLTNGPYTVNRAITFQNAASTNYYTAVVGGNSAHTSYYTGTITVNDPNAGTYQLTAAANGRVEFSGLITDGTRTKAIQKTGAGTVVLSRASGNTFDGGMNVLAGTLLVTNTSGSATGTGAVTVAAGATLGGTGIITGATTVNGTLAPGASAGTLTISNSLTLDSGATLAFELNGTDTTVGGNINDLVTGVTNLTLDGTLNVTETVSGSFMSATAGSKWRLFNYTGTLTDNVLTLGTMPTVPSGWSFSLDTSTANQVNLVLIPEPGTVGMAAVGLLLARFMRRRRI